VCLKERWPPAEASGAAQSRKTPITLIAVSRTCTGEHQAHKDQSKKQNVSQTDGTSVSGLGKKMSQGIRSSILVENMHNDRAI
jgi:hypothetical protein